VPVGTRATMEFVETALKVGQADAGALVVVLTAAQRGPALVPNLVAGGALSCGDLGVSFGGHQTGSYNGELAVPLFSFNLGVELGQVAIVAAVAMRALPVVCLAAVLPSLLLVRPLQWAFATPSADVPIPALGANVMWNLGTNTMLATALALASVL